MTSKALSDQRIAIFQAEWPFQVHTANCAYGLAKAGYSVDIFLYETRPVYDFRALQNAASIRLHDLSEKKHNFLILRWKRWVLKIREVYLWWRGDKVRSVLPSKVLSQTASLLKDKKYHCFIGVEKKGLVWAGYMATHRGIPFIYYSLELYTWGHPFVNSSFRNRRLKLLEQKFHRLSCATLVQDARRAEVLLRDNGLSDTAVVHLPISLVGPVYEKSNGYLQQRLALGDEMVLILQFGQIGAERLSFSLAQEAQRFPEDWRLVMHSFGYASQDDIDGISHINGNKRVLLSLEHVPDKRLQEMIHSAHIGLVLYKDTTDNDKLTAFSSEKLALYLQCGLPIIAFNYPGYEFVEELQCGVLIEHTGELEQAVRIILNRYDSYRDKAYRCFQQYFDFDVNFTKVIQFIDELRL